MSRNRTICLGVVIAAGSVLIFLALTLTAPPETGADRTIKAKITVSRHRVRPGEVVEFKFKLVDSKGRSKPIPRSAHSRGSSPRLALYDSRDRKIGTYKFRFG